MIGPPKSGKIINDVPSGICSSRDKRSWRPPCGIVAAWRLPDRGSAGVRNAELGDGFFQLDPCRWLELRLLNHGASLPREECHQADTAAVGPAGCPTSETHKRRASPAKQSVNSVLAKRPGMRKSVPAAPPAWPRSRLIARTPARPGRAGC